MKARIFLVLPLLLLAFVMSVEASPLDTGFVAVQLEDGTFQVMFPDVSPRPLCDIRWTRRARRLRLEFKVECSSGFLELAVDEKDELSSPSPSFSAWNKPDLQLSEVVVEPSIHSDTSSSDALQAYDMRALLSVRRSICTDSKWPLFGNTYELIWTSGREGTVTLLSNAMDLLKFLVKISHETKTRNPLEVVWECQGLQGFGFQCNDEVTGDSRIWVTQTEKSRFTGKITIPGWTQSGESRIIRDLAMTLLFIFETH